MIFLKVSILLALVLCLVPKCFSKPMEETAIGTQLYDADEFDSPEQLFDIDQHLQEKRYEVKAGVRNETAESYSRAPRQSSSNHFQVPESGCSMNLRPNMDGVAVYSSLASDYQIEGIFAELDGRSTIALTESWCGQPGHSDWIEIKFEAPRLVAGIVTQGSPSSDYWTRTYRLLCLSEQGSYKEYIENGRAKTFTGNSNRNSKVFNIFSETLSCLSIRIIPKTWHSKPCLRIDLLHEGCYAPVRHQFEVTSKGADDGWFCSIRVNGIEKALNRRGFCVVSFDPHSLTFKASTYDTYGDHAGQSAQMSSFLASLPAYSVVAIAVKDTAVVSSGSTVHSNIRSHAEALGAVGIPCDLTHYGYRDSFSFIGQKSTRPAWISCQHVQRHRGYAVVHATISTSRRFIVH